MVQFKQRKGARKVRERSSRLEAEEGDSSGPASSIPLKAKKANRTKITSALSFADDVQEEEEEMFQSKKRHQQKEKQRRRRKAGAGAGAGAVAVALEQEVPRALAATSSRHGEYTQEKIAQLREGTSFLTPAVPLQEENESPTSDGQGLKIQPVPVDVSVEDNDTEMEEVGEVIIGEEETDEVIQGVRMSHSMVEHARRKRARMREIGGASADFIPLGEDQEMTSVRFTRSSSDQSAAVEPGRAEEETTLYGREMRSRIGFGDPGKKDEKKERQKSLRELQDEDEEMMDEDDEVRQWEMERMKHGAQVRAKGSRELTAEERGIQGLARPALKESKTEIAIRSISDFQAELSGHIGKVEEGLEHVSARLLQITGKVEEERGAVEGINATLADVGEQFRFFQRVRTYVKALMACVDHVMPTIVELEDKLMDVDEAEQDIVLEREQEHLRYLKALVRRGEVLDDDMGERRVDELGRDTRSRARLLVEEEMQMRAKLRARKQSSRSQWQHGTMEPEGFSSDEETDEEDSLDNRRELSVREGLETVERERETLQSRVRDVFNDVEKDYCELREIKAVFAEWKSGFRDSYDSTYCESSLAEVYSPFVRVQLLLWRPLHSDKLPFWMKESDSDADDIELPSTAGLGSRPGLGAREKERRKSFEGNNYTDLEWFRSLTQGITPSDQEWAVVRKLLEDDIVPVVKHAISAQWNPLSRKQTGRLINVLSSLQLHLPEESGVLDGLKIRALAVLTDASSSMGSLSQCPRGSSEQQENACRRLFWIHAKLLRCCLYFLRFIAFDSLSPVTRTLLEGILAFCGAPVTRGGLSLLKRFIDLIPIRNLLQFGTSGDIIRLVEALASENPSMAEELLLYLRTEAIEAAKANAGLHVSAE